MTCMIIRFMHIINSKVINYLSVYLKATLINYNISTYYSQWHLILYYCIYILPLKSTHMENRYDDDMSMSKSKSIDEKYIILRGVTNVTIVLLFQVFICWCAHYCSSKITKTIFQTYYTKIITNIILLISYNI